ncbi:transcription elongation factor B polypeptide 3-like [Sipha flava]|uniref:Transcription elongation factor B polypeptide 3-like n=1 Tax=Sipha flava TaxID=143950 RepID=A0A8B8F8P2_9HEMI|nr:transcription elongation factor B polypeptide 3-like [Sipha flava]
MDSAAAGSSTKQLNESGSSLKNKRKFVEEIDPLNEMLSRKYKRTKMYAGRKRAVNPEVPSLKDTCINSLKKNLDDLKSTQGIPFDYLEPALKFATPEQLHRIEKNNIYLMQHTNKLWEHHTKKHFPNEYPYKDESWRDVYFTCVEKREDKFNVLRLMMKSNSLNNKRGIVLVPAAKW